MPNARNTAPNYCKLHGLPEPNWRYRPYHGRYGTHRCSYCGLAADTVDTIPGMPQMSRTTQYKRVVVFEVWLVDCCHDCRRRLGDEPPPTIKLRQQALLVALRRAYNSHRGARTSKARRELEYRVQVASGLRKPM